MRRVAAILLGKVTTKLIRIFKLGGGSAAPGLMALKIYPNLVQDLTRGIPQNVVITGTNGKTTTARILAHLAKEAGLKVIRNHTGSNLERGIASALLQNLRSFDLGIWELDEAAFNTVVPKIKLDTVIFLNISRDQLDRYGEVDKVVNNWCQALSSLNPETLVLINADEPDLAKLKSSFKGKIEEFGKKDLKDIKLNGLNGSEFKINNLEFKINLPGMYHIYDVLAAITCALHLKLPISKLTNFQPAFGRFEKLPFGYIFLIKNPAGATEDFKTIAPHIRPQDRLLLALNDNIADGTDVSWIWDAEFERLPKTHTYVSGKRAYDLAVRLKYAGLKSIYIESSLKKALRASRKGLKGKLFILPTYTAMLKLQGILAKQGLKPHYWEDK